MLAKPLLFLLLTTVVYSLAKPARESGSSKKSNNSTAKTDRKDRATYLPSVIKICAFNIKTFGKAKMSDPVKAAIIRDVCQKAGHVC